MSQAAAGREGEQSRRGDWGRDGGRSLVGLINQEGKSFLPLEQRREQTSMLTLREAGKVLHLDFLRLEIPVIAHHAALKRRERRVIAWFS